MISWKNLDALAACEKLPETQRIFYLKGYLPARTALVLKIANRS